MNKQDFEYKLSIVTVGYDYIFNQGQSFKHTVHTYFEIQIVKQEKLQSLDNDCFGC